MHALHPTLQCLLISIVFGTVIPASYFILKTSIMAKDRFTDVVGGTGDQLKACVMLISYVLNEKALKCKPSALIFGCGRAKELLHDLRKRTR